MSSRTRFWVIATVTFVISCAVVVLTAYNVGADPFHSRSRHIWALSLVAAAYASVRIAMVVNRFFDARAADDGGSALSGVPFFGKKDHVIDRRMAARRARVEAAQKTSKETTSSKEDEGDD